MTLSEQAIRRHLELEGVSENAENLARILLEQCLTWSVSAPEMKQIDALLTFAFGNRIDDYGNRTPGPVNAQLADVVESLYQEFNCTVIAQWEIAQLLLNRIPPEHLISVNPIYDSASDRVNYLSTAGVLKQARDILNDTKTIYVVAHRDHLVRCLQTAQRLGFDAVSDSDKMPNDYDALSSQVWTRNRETYLVSDMISRLAAVQQELIESLEKGGRDENSSFSFQ